MREGKENSTKTLFSHFQVQFLKKRAELHNLKKLRAKLKNSMDSYSY